MSTADFLSNHTEVNLDKGITDEQFKKIAEYLSSKYGLRIPKEKKTMFESRFTKRLNALKLSSFTEYFNYVFSKKGNNEYLNFIDLATTHKTFFFREDYQFDFIKNILPMYLAATPSKSSVNVWSAGCSTGEEVYTLAMVLNEFKEIVSAFDYKIVGTDISIPALQKASKGIFSGDELKNIPSMLQEKYFKVRTGATQDLVFTNTQVSAKINLGVLNLNNPVYNLKEQFDFIFCRNVIIYFDAVTQKKVMEKLVGKLKPGGYLFLGHSETAIGSSLPIRSIRPTIYQKMK